MPKNIDIIDAVGIILAQNGAGRWVDPDTIPPPGDKPAVWVKHYPTDLPSLTLNVYDMSEEIDPAEKTLLVRLQVRARHTTNADDIAEDARRALHGVHAYAAPRAYIHRIRHLSTAQLGHDGTADNRTDNYELLIRKDNYHD